MRCLRQRLAQARAGRNLPSVHGFLSSTFFSFCSSQRVRDFTLSSSFWTYAVVTGVFPPVRTRAFIFVAHRVQSIVSPLFSSFVLVGLHRSVCIEFRQLALSSNCQPVYLKECSLPCGTRTYDTSASMVARLTIEPPGKDSMHTAARPPYNFDCALGKRCWLTV